MNLGAFSVSPAVKVLQRHRRASTRSSGSRWSGEAQGAGWRVRGPHIAHVRVVARFGGQVS